MINYNTKENVVRLEFSLRGVDTNDDEENLIYDVMLSEMNIDCSLLNEYTKWNLYKNGELLYNGNFAPEFDGNVLTDNLIKYGQLIISIRQKYIKVLNETVKNIAFLSFLVINLYTIYKNA